VLRVHFSVLTFGTWKATVAHIPVLFQVVAVLFKSCQLHEFLNLLLLGALILEQLAVCCFRRLFDKSCQLREFLKMLTAKQSIGLLVSPNLKGVSIC